jgi:hypothetical protein
MWGAKGVWTPVLRRLLRQLTTLLLYRDFDPMVMEPAAEALLALLSADLVRVGATRRGGGGGGGDAAGGRGWGRG